MVQIVSDDKYKSLCDMMLKKMKLLLAESYDVEAGDDVFRRTKYDNEQIEYAYI